MDRSALAPLNICTTSAGLAAGTTTTLTSARDQHYSINDLAYYKAAATNEATPTTDAVTGAAFTAVGVSKGSVFAICRDTAGALKVVQGQILDLNAQNTFPGPLPLLPAIPDSLCMYGSIVVKVGSTGSAWTFGSSNLAGPPTGVTFTFNNHFTAPSRPKP